MPAVLLGHPFFSTDTPTHLYIWHSAALRLSGDHSGCSKPSLSPQGLFAVPVPVTPPCLPRGHIRGLACGCDRASPAAAGIPFLPAVSARRDRSRHSGQGGGALGLLSSGTPTHNPWQWCRGWQGHTDCFYFLLRCSQAGQPRDPCGELLTPQSEEQGWQQGMGGPEQSPFPVWLVFGHTWARHG